MQLKFKCIYIDSLARSIFLLSYFLTDQFVIILCVEKATSTLVPTKCSTDKNEPTVTVFY